MNLLGPIELPAGIGQRLARALGGANKSLPDDMYLCPCNSTACLVRQALEEEVTVECVASTAANAKDLIPGKTYPVLGQTDSDTDEADDGGMSTVDEDGVRFVGKFFVGAHDAPLDGRPLSFPVDYVEALRRKMEAHYAEKRKAAGITEESEGDKPAPKDKLERDRDHYQKLLDVIELTHTQCPFEKTALIEIRPEMNTGTRPSKNGYIHIVMDNTVRGYMSHGEPFDMVIAMIDSDGERMIFNANSARYKLVSDDRIIALVNPTKE